MTASNNVTTTNAYFDLNDYIRSMQTVDVAAQMAQSVAFSVDININNAARQLMKNLRTEHIEHGIDSLSEMTAALEDSAFAEEIMRQAGKDELGPVSTILQLNTMRDAWHELASELTSMTYDWQGIPRGYEIKPIEEMLLREVRLQVKPVTAQRLRVQIERRADGASKEDIDTVYAKRLEREQQKVKDMSRTMTEQQGAIVTLYHLACQIGTSLPQLTIETDSYSDVSFHQLDASLRRQLIEAAMKGAARAEDYATNSSSITDAEFDAISFAVIKVERELKAVLAGPAYRVVEASRRDSLRVAI